MWRSFLLGVFSFLISVPAHAAWHEVSGEHFIIYSDQNASTTKAFAERLEKFHAGMAFMLQTEPVSPSTSNRVTVFVVDNESKVRKLADLESKYTAGVYRPRAGNIVAIVPRLRSSSNKFALSPEVILQHEYAHHFLFNITNRTFPLWYQEGFAEFYASSNFERDGTMIMGAQAVHRAYELALSREVPIELLLDTTAYLKAKSSGYDQFYGRSWLLYHYLTFEKSRRGQMVTFQELLSKGVSEPEAALKAFGDLNQLDRDLDRYARNRKIAAAALPPEKLVTSQVRVRRLTDGEDEMMPVIMESRTGVDEDEAQQVVLDARRIAAKYPDDAGVQEALAEAEYDAGFDAQALVAADRALALDPKRIRAQIQKIYVAARAAETAQDEEAAWRKVRKEIVAANRIENDNPIPLIQYYRSYKEQGMQVPELAIDGLYRALELAPYDGSIRWMMASQYMEDGKYQFAATIIEPLAFNPHRSPLTDAAATLLEIAKTKAKEASKSVDIKEQPGS